MRELRPLKHSVAKELHNAVNMRLNDRVDLRKNSVRFHKQKCCVLFEVAESFLCCMESVSACYCGKCGSHHVSVRWFLTGNKSISANTFS